MAFIIINYLSIYMERAVADHYDLYEVDDFDMNTAGSRLIGRDISTLLSNYETTKIKVSDILKSELEKEEGSILINQITDTHSGLKHDLVLECLQQIILGINED